MAHQCEASEKTFIVRCATDTVETSVVGDLKYLEDVIVLNGCPNLVSLKFLEDKATVDYCFKKYFKVTFEDKREVYFKRDASGMYKARIKYFIGQKTYSQICRQSTAANDITAVSEIVVDREKRFSKQQVSLAKKAREIKRNLGFPSDGGLSYAINNGALLNCPITTSDVARATQIYGPDPYELQGKHHRQQQMPVVFEPAEMSTDKMQELHVDAMEVDGEQFILSVVHPVSLIMVSGISERSNKYDIKRVITTHRDIVESQGFTCKRGFVDGGSTLKSLALRTWSK